MASRSICIALAWGWAFVLLSETGLRADGYHGPVMMTAAPEAWVASAFQQMNAEVPNLQQKLQGAPRASGVGSSKLKVGDASDLRNRTAAPPENTGRKTGTPATERAKTPQPGGRLQAEFTERERAFLGRASAASLDVLAYLTPENIVPGEFPSFPVNRVAEYRAGAKQILGATGPVGADAVVQSLRSQLMGGAGQVGFGFDLNPHPQYHKDLMEALQDAAAAGYVTRQHVNSLQEAAAGDKAGSPAALAQEVQQLLPELDGVSLATVLKWAEKTEDPQRKQELYARAERWITSAGIGELIEASQSLAENKDLKQAKRFPQLVANELAKRAAKADFDDLILLFENKVELDSRSEQAAERTLLARLDKATIAQLLAAAEHGPAAVEQGALARLAQLSPTYAEVKDQLPQIWTYAKSQKADVREAARQQTANAFQRAPLARCLDWLAVADAAHKELIWAQVEARIARADSAKRTEYRQTALQVAGMKESETGVRTAAVELLGRLKDPGAVSTLVDLLPQMPRESWPAAGASLRALTGQDFGPKAGDGVGEVSAALKKWRAWLAANGK